MDPGAEAVALTVGVAGHVDHGKTALVRALTGVETDRLPEEQRRGISIELGFAPLPLPDAAPGGLVVGLCDMPGHERFVRRMIAGAAGVDAVMLIVAADEGVMPQAREHLAICRLLGLRHGLLVLTKADLADADLLDLLELELGELCRDTFLHEAEVVRFSTRPAEPWLPELRAALGRLGARVLRDRDATLRGRPFRMPIDRAFVLPGHGTVVTGTALAGSVAVGDALTLMPGATPVRVRGLQRHGAPALGFVAPGRVALQIAGAGAVDVGAGAVIAASEAVVVSDRLDVALEVLDHSPAAVIRRSRYMLHLGTARVECAVTPLGSSAARGLLPGEAGVAQLHLDAAIAVAPGDRFVLRGSHDDARHGRTVAGGRLLHPCPPRHRLDDDAVVSLLHAVASPDDEAGLVAMVALHGAVGLLAADLPLRLPWARGRLDKALQRALGRGALRKFTARERLWTPDVVAALEAQLLERLATLHLEAPERVGATPAELSRRLGAQLEVESVHALAQGLLKRGALRAAGPGAAEFALPSFVVRSHGPSPALREALIAALEAGGPAPPTGSALWQAARERLMVPPGEDVATDAATFEAALTLEVQAGRALRHGDVAFGAGAFAFAAAAAFTAFADAEEFDTAALKDLLGLTRKHLIPLAELFDAKRLTVRDASGLRRFRSRALDAYRAGERPWALVVEGEAPGSTKA